MAQVFAATHRNGRAVAIKMLRPELAVEPPPRRALFARGLCREQGQPSQIAVAVLDDDVLPDGSAHFGDGTPARQSAVQAAERRRCPLPPDEVLRIGDSTLDVLAAAHDKGIVHRDIKPDNLFRRRPEKSKCSTSVSLVCANLSIPEDRRGRA